MKDKRVPSLDNLFNPVIDALNALGGSGTNQEILDKVIDMLKISDEIANIPHKGKGRRTQLEYNIAWARTFLKAFGTLENPRRGLWFIAPGMSVKKVDPEEVVRNYRGQNRSENNDGRRERSEESDTVSLEAEEEYPWRIKLSEVLTKLSPDAFERLTQLLLRECGFIEVNVTGRSGDGGIDGDGIAKVNDLMSFPMVFQCKHYSYKNPVTPNHIRDFRGAMVGRADKGLFITTSTFTRSARAEATKLGAPPIDLIDGIQLMEKLKELRMGIKVEEEIVENITINEDWYQKI